MIAVAMRESEQDFSLTRGALKFSGSDRNGIDRPDCVEQIDADNLLMRLRESFPGWAIVADLRGGRWVAANGEQEIWRCDGASLLKALIETTGSNSV
ncbi:hypothetical protein [Actinomadura sp. 3N508]|uniref:hypothetical protein n=1 Tax=Actinomadura sp. 3N508 TaxID=3375153 RepID=UPI00378EA5F1